MNFPSLIPTKISLSLSCLPYDERLVSESTVITTTLSLSKVLTNRMTQCSLSKTDRQFLEIHLYWVSQEVPYIYDFGMLFENRNSSDVQRWSSVWRRKVSPFPTYSGRPPMHTLYVPKGLGSRQSFSRETGRRREVDTVSSFPRGSSVESWLV